MSKLTLSVNGAVASRAKRPASRRGRTDPVPGSDAGFEKLGSAQGQSLRIFVDNLTYHEVMKHRKPNHELSEFDKKHREKIEAAAVRRAKGIRSRGKGNQVSKPDMKIGGCKTLSASPEKYASQNR